MKMNKSMNLRNYISSTKFYTSHLTLPVPPPITTTGEKQYNIMSIFMTSSLCFSTLLLSLCHND